MAIPTNIKTLLSGNVVEWAQIEETTVAGKKAFSVAGNFLIACFDTDVTDEVIMEIAKKKPVYFVTRDPTASPPTLTRSSLPTAPIP